ncbi:MAG: hypothetical protein IKF14_08385 [Atopobiaceae bacterium]|nr:hypothetical protein [Atopobiaceae bacterium]
MSDWLANTTSARHSLTSPKDANLSDDYYWSDEAYPPDGSHSPRPGGMPDGGFFELSTRGKVIAIAVLLIVGLLSFFVIGEWAISPESHGPTINALDEKKDTVMTLVAGSSGTSTAITLLPGDAGTPIAEKLVDLSSDFLIVIAAIYLEKYLLTIIGFLAFKVIIPLGCVLLLPVVLMRSQARLRMTLFNLVARVSLLAIAMYCVVPVSVFVSGMIERTYEASLNKTITNAQQTAAAIEESTQESEKEEEPQGIIETLQNIPNAITQLPDEVAGWLEEAKVALNNFIEALAVMIVTSCIIPILVLVFFLWLVKSLLGVSVDLPMGYLRPRSMRKMRHGKR